MITVHDFTMLGTTVPEERRSDGRTFVCSAGYASDLGLIRIYPLARTGAPQRWSRSTIDLERNPKDSRPESWRIASGRTPDTHASINNQFHRTGTVTRTRRAELVPDKYYVTSIKQANERRLSLALIRPTAARIVWTKADRREPLDLHQLDMLAELGNGWQHPDRERIPRMQFTDADGDHLLQLRDWGTYELIRKRGIDYAYDNLSGALRVGPESVLLVGNINRHRTSWLVISVLSFAVQQLALQVAS